MSELRNQLNPTIIKLLREHDNLPYENASARKVLQRQLLSLMSIVKLHEQELAWQQL